MFYEKRPKNEQEAYKQMLKIMGSLSRLFSDSETPYLYYRCHENLFCKYFDAENLSRADVSADAKKEKIGIGLKTWTGSNDQKVAEFDKLKSQYAGLKGLDLARKIAEFRNDRIEATKRIYGIEEMIYHVVKRKHHLMMILEQSFDEIDIGNIVLLPSKNKKKDDSSVYFSDGKHRYHFNSSKSTLFMLFDDLEELDSFEVEILADPYELLSTLFGGSVASNCTKMDNSTPIVENLLFPAKTASQVPAKEQLCLRLYSTNKDGKFVPERSGLNQWNANGRKRDTNEIYIPYPQEDRKRNPTFFPDRNISFDLVLPDGTHMSAKVCQDGGKAIMSNPNKELGKWLLRKVFNLKEGTLLTYNLLLVLDIDCVIFTKLSSLSYSIDFAKVGTYESFYLADGEEVVRG